MKNLCGKCNACCTALRIDKNDMSWREADKEAGETCDKLCDGRCSIYKERPFTCKQYECLWLQLSKELKDLPVGWRSDNIKAIVSTFYYEDTKTFRFRIKELEEDTLDVDNNIELKKYLDLIFQVANQQKGTPEVSIELFGDKVGHALKQNIGG
jgi:hypothetical protein